MDTQERFGDGNGDTNDHPSQFSPAESGVRIDPPKLYSQAELEDAIDRDRIAGFMAFTSFLNPAVSSLVHGTSHQALAIRRALIKAGYI